jgi:hypothetical protein
VARRTVRREACTIVANNKICIAEEVVRSQTHGETSDTYNSSTQQSVHRGTRYEQSWSKMINPSANFS